MLRIVLIRPGSSEYDQQGRIQGNLDIPLSEEGRREVLQTIEELRGEGIEILYAPACEPAQQTGEALAQALDIKLKRLDKMENLDHGLWQGMLVDDVRRKQPKVYRQWQEQPEIVCPPEGEMPTEAICRVRATMTKLLKRHREGVVGLVVPEPLASLVKCFLKHEGIGDLWKASLEHGRWEAVDLVPAQAINA